MAFQVFVVESGRSPLRSEVIARPTPQPGSILKLNIAGVLRAIQVESISQNVIKHADHGSLDVVIGSVVASKSPAHAETLAPATDLA